MTSEEKAVLEAAVEMTEGSNQWNPKGALEAAVRAYRKSLEPKARWTVNTRFGVWWVDGAGITNPYAIANCDRRENAERIAAALNREEEK